MVIEYEKTAESTSDLIGYKIADKISQNLEQNNLEIIINQHNKKILREIYISKRKTKYY